MYYTHAMINNISKIVVLVHRILSIVSKRTSVYFYTDYVIRCQAGKELLSFSAINGNLKFSYFKD